MLWKVVLKACSFFILGKLAPSFDRWLTVARQEKELTVIRRHAISVLYHYQLSRGWRCWVEKAAERRWAVLVTRRAIAHCFHKGMCVYFQHWRRLTEIGKAKDAAEVAKKVSEWEELDRLNRETEAAAANNYISLADDTALIESDWLPNQVLGLLGVQVVPTIPSPHPQVDEMTPSLTHRKFLGWKSYGRHIP